VDGGGGAVDEGGLDAGVDDRGKVAAAPALVVVVPD
jgi:hypothetical protein